MSRAVLHIILGSFICTTGWMAGPTILVTGGAGYIGSHTCKALHSAGFAPVVFDNLETGRADRVLWGSLIEGDLNQYEEIASAIRQTQPVAIIHFAASIQVGESVQNPGKYYRNNTVATLNLLEAMHSAGYVCPLIFSSTGAVYGTPKEVPISEESLLHPESPYGASKAMSERMICDYYHAYHQPYCILRYFNACGADPEGELGADPSLESRLVAVAVKAGVQGTPLSLFGVDWPTPDGTAIRDYIHVSDLAEAHVCALKALLDGKEDSLTCNLGVGRGISVLEVIRGVEEVLKKALDVRLCVRRPGDVPISIADVQRMCLRLGFTPQHSSLEEMIRTSYQWQLRWNREVVVQADVVATGQSS